MHAGTRDDHVPDADLHLEHLGDIVPGPGRLPILAAALLVLEADRARAHVFNPTNGGPLLWQHLFWFFGHPEVYIIALPFFGIITEVLPVFSRKPIFRYVDALGPRC